MLRLSTRFVETALVSALALALASPAMAGMVYSWTTEDGTYAFTDDPKRIPARYREQAERRPLGKLRAYSRLTPAPPVERIPYGGRLETRLSHLRERAAAAEQERAAAGGLHAGVATLDLRIAGGRYGEQAGLGLPIAADSDEPVVVEEIRTRSEGQLSTRHVTIVRQGDEILAVVKPQQNDEDITPPEESELLPD